VSPVTELGFSWSWSAIALICEGRVGEEVVGIRIQANILSGSGFESSDPNRTNMNPRYCNWIQLKCVYEIFVTLN